MGEVIPDWAGYLAIAIAGVSFGSNFVPVKWYSKQIGDGLFFQWIFCCAVWLAGFIVFTSRGFPKFEPFAMLGGLLWCTGNIMTVPIIKCVGLSVGMLLWCLSNLLMGWASGTFGLFGLKKEDNVNLAWNILGAVFAALSGAAFGVIEPNTSEKLVKADHNKINDEDVSRLLTMDEGPAEKNFLDNLSPVQKKTVGVIMALLAGVFYGANFNPPQYLIERCDICSKQQLDYVFPHFCGIFITSTLYFLVYCVAKENKPFLPSEVAFPGFLSGSMWALAQVCWFIANTQLGFVITFPTLSIIPGVIASMWGICVFREITGRKNLLLFCLGLIMAIISIACTVISKER